MNIEARIQYTKSVYKLMKIIKKTYQTHHITRVLTLTPKAGPL